MIERTREIIKKPKYVPDHSSILIEDPDFVFIETINSRCNAYEISIKEGDYVKVGQEIGMRHGAFFDQPIHSSVSGQYIGLEKHYHRTGKIIDFLKIQNDHKDVLDSSIQMRSDEEVASLDRAKIQEIVKTCSMVGLGGSSFPTYVKFQTKDKIKYVLINGIECEPFITSDQVLMNEESTKVCKGMELVRRAFEAEKCILCIKSHKKGLIKFYQELLSKFEGLEVCGVGNYYPQGWEVEMIKSCLGIHVKPGELSSKYGVVSFNVSSVAGIYDAVKFNKPVVSRYISVAGNGIQKEGHFKVRLGTPVSELIARCGGYKNPDKPKVLIVGGPMMGSSLTSDDLIATKTVTQLIILDKVEYKEEPCVRCGSCVYSCPAGLEPVQIMHAVKSADRERVKFLHPERCVECGLCTFSCTSKINVLDYIRRGKLIAKL